MEHSYDVIIVGASFAGLAVARELRGRVLVIDRKPIGSSRTSACGTLLEVPMAFGATDAVLQVYKVGYIHTPIRTLTYPLPYAFCTLDYQRFCTILAQQSEFKFLNASVLDLDGNRILTSNEAHEGRILVDASGWWAVLGRHLDPTLVDRGKLSFGLETEIPLRGQGLYFWVDPKVIQRGVGWDFPCGSTSRIGVGSYAGQSSLGTLLKSFAGGLSLQLSGLRGGFFTSFLRRARAGQVFLAGDAAGHCLPLTGEGIRPALYFGQQCGKLIQRVLDGEATLEEALAAYDRLVESYRPVYNTLKVMEDVLSRLPPPLLQPILESVSNPWLCNHSLRLYRARTPGRAFGRPFCESPSANAPC